MLEYFKINVKIIRKKFLTSTLKSFEDLMVVKILKMLR